MITFINDLLIKLVIKTATTASADEAYGIAERNYFRTGRIISILEAPLATQLSARATLGASDSAGQNQVADILDHFLTLSDEDKAKFIRAYKATATIVGSGLTRIVRERTYQGGHIPPRYEP